VDGETIRHDASRPRTWAQRDGERPALSSAHL